MATVSIGDAAFEFDTDIDAVLFAITREELEIDIHANNTASVRKLLKHLQVKRITVMFEPCVHETEDQSICCGASCVHKTKFKSIYCNAYATTHDQRGVYYRTRIIGDLDHEGDDYVEHGYGESRHRTEAECLAWQDACERSGL